MEIKLPVIYDDGYIFNGDDQGNTLLKIETYRSGRTELNKQEIDEIGNYIAKVINHYGKLGN